MAGFEPLHELQEVPSHDPPDFILPKPSRLETGNECRIRGGITQVGRCGGDAITVRGKNGIDPYGEDLHLQSAALGLREIDMGGAFAKFVLLFEEHVGGVTVSVEDERASSTRCCPFPGLD